ncbi:MAG: arginine decarboxylase, pyruvoyl-dependent [Sedimentisphaerales bacterium]|nr:arginine decarboxylase, pyruvoyl-dependent [Sedimentisphaerales bacterium]
MSNLVPTKVFLTKGVGQDKYELKSFEHALRQAGVAQQNLVQVSSILPPKCKIISKEKGIQMLQPGAICFCVMARSKTNEYGRMIASSIGVAIPKEETKWGYLSEIHSHGMNNQTAGDMAEDLAADMLGTTLGIELDPETAWSEKEQAYKSSGLFVKTTNITQTAKGKDGLWTTALAMAVFLFD